MSVGKLPTFLFKRSTAEAFKAVLAYHAPPPRKVLDCTAGFRRMWARIAYTSLNDNSTQRTLTEQEGYMVTFLDIRPEVKPDIVGDHTKLTELFKPKSFDAAVYDPPWVPSGKYKGTDGKTKSSIYAVPELYAVDKPLDPKVFDRMNEQLYDALRYKGLVIMKIGDIKECYYHIEAANRFRSFTLEDLIVCPWQQPVGAGRRNHYFFMVFRKRG